MTERCDFDLKMRKNKIIYPDVYDNNQKVRDKIAGSLYGLLTGDAFGCPVEGWPPSKIQAFHGTPDVDRLETKISLSGTSNGICLRRVVIPFHQG